MDAAASDRESNVIAAFVGLADTLVADYDVIDVLDRLVRHSVELLAAEAAGILLVDARGELRLVASSDERSEWTETLQLQADEGPCLDCVRSGAPVSVADLSEMAGRWPRFVPALQRQASFGSAASFESAGPFRSVHSLPLRLRGEAVGALNLFRRDPGALPSADLALGQALADVATIGILQERALRRGEALNEQLQVALNSRVVIEQAKGVLAQRGNLGMEVAFDRLRTFARRHNLRLSDVARQVVQTDLAAEVLAVRRARGKR